MNRRELLLASGVGVSSLLAGCSSDDTDGGNGNGNSDSDRNGNGDRNGDSDDNPEQAVDEDAETVDAVVGSLVAGENIHLVVEDVETATRTGEFQEADDGNEFLIATVAVKNVSDEYVSVSQLLQTSVRDDEDYSYDQSIAVTEQPSFNDGQFAPGEVERGTIVYELPRDATGRTLQFDFDVSLVGGIERAEIDLEAETDSHTLEQELAIDVHDVGETVSYGDVSVTVDDIEFEDALGPYTQPEAGNEYAVVDISITNDTGEQQHISTILQMLVKDGEGWSYQEDLMGSSQLDRSFDESSALSDGETRRGQLAYEVERGSSPLYWVFEFTRWNDGDKTFWRLR